MHDSIREALAKAAGALVERQLTADDKDSLYTNYLLTDGTENQKALKVLGQFTGLTPEQIQLKRSSDDNADRIFRDLEGLLDE